jgi:hypothetical protein
MPNDPDADLHVTPARERLAVAARLVNHAIVTVRPQAVENFA